MDDENYAEVSGRITEIEDRLDDIDQAQERVSKILDSREVREALVLLSELNGWILGDRKTGTPGLRSIVYGSKALGVKPIRDMMTDFADDLGVVMTTHARWRWLLGILSLTSVAGVIGWILFLREIAGVP